MSLSLLSNILRFSAMMLFAEPVPMMLALIGYTLSSCFLSSSRLPFVPVTTKSSPCVKPEVFRFLLWNKFLELRLQLVKPIFEKPLPVSFPIAYCISGIVHALLQAVQFTLWTFLSSLLLAISQAQAFEALAWKYARETSTCISENSGI